MSKFVRKYKFNKILSLFGKKLEYLSNDSVWEMVCSGGGGSNNGWC